jgi:hypothetical protein
MLERNRNAAWGARLGFGALLFVCSEWIVWQTPLDFGPLEWLGIAAITLALAALALDLIARFHVNDLTGLLFVAGLYGLVDATLISHITTRDLPLSLIVRPLGTLPLAFLLALGAFVWLAGRRVPVPLVAGVALVAGLAWGVWIRWFPIVSDEPVSAPSLGTALVAVGIGLALGGLIRWAGPPLAITRREDWLLAAPEAAAMGIILLAGLVWGAVQDLIDALGVVIVAMLSAYLLMLLYMTTPTRRPPSLLGAISPPRRPALAPWLAAIGAFLAAGWIGHALPGEGDGALQSDLLFGALTAFGVVWLPVASIVAGVRAVVQMARDGF